MRIADLFKQLFRTPDSSRQIAVADAAPQRGDESVTRWQQALADFGYPYSLAAGESAEEVLAAERELGLQQGFMPVVIVPGLWNSTRMTAEKRTARARRLMGKDHGPSFGKDFLAAKFDSLHDDLMLDPECPDPALFDTLQPVTPQAPATGLSLLRSFNTSTRSLEHVAQAAIMRIPTPHSWAIPVYLDWGGWNACPSSLEIAAVARYWEKTHGARLVAMGPDQLEFSSARKPAGHAEAVALLKQHYCFAPDTWEFDRSMLEQAAAELQVNDSWVFRWD